MPYLSIACLSPRFDITVVTSVLPLSTPSSLSPIARMPMTWSPLTTRPRESTAMHRSASPSKATPRRSEEHTSELQSRFDLVCRLLLEKKKFNEFYLLG